MHSGKTSSTEKGERKAIPSGVRGRQILHAHTHAPQQQCDRPQAPTQKGGKLSANDITRDLRDSSLLSHSYKVWLVAPPVTLKGRRGGRGGREKEKDAHCPFSLEIHDLLSSTFFLLCRKVSSRAPRPPVISSYPHWMKYYGGRVGLRYACTTITLCSATGSIFPSFWTFGSMCSKHGFYTNAT